MTGLDYYVKEFSKISMDPGQTIIIDNQPISYSLNKGMYFLGFMDIPPTGSILTHSDNNFPFVPFQQRVPSQLPTFSMTKETMLCWTSYPAWKSSDT